MCRKTQIFWIAYIGICPKPARFSKYDENIFFGVGLQSQLFPIPQHRRKYHGFCKEYHHILVTDRRACTLTISENIGRIYENVTVVDIPGGTLSIAVGIITACAMLRKVYMCTCNHASQLYTPAACGHVPRVWFDFGIPHVKKYSNSLQKLLGFEHIPT